jgi:hypothetical protein
MVWDLSLAMYKKQEFECARLIEFEFKLRARTMRLLAQELGVSPDDLICDVALGPDDMILDRLAVAKDWPRSAIDGLYDQVRLAARAQLIKEIGDPSPNRLG